MKRPLFRFNSGEVMPELWWRSDLAKYVSSCKELKNFIIQAQGGIKRRLGTEFQARIGDKGQFSNMRLLKWEIDRENYFQLVIAGQKAYVYNNSGALVDVIDSVPWSDDDLSELYIKQVTDVMFVAHPKYPLQRIERTAQFAFRCVAHDFFGGPFGAENIDETLSFSVGTGSSPTITASSDTFSSDDVGRQVRMLRIGANNLSGKFGTGTAGQSSATIGVTGSLTLRTEGGIWDGRLELQQSLDGGSSWEVLGSIESEDGKANGEIIRDVDSFGALVRVHMATRGAAPSDSGCFWYLDVPSVQYNYYEITGYTSATEVTADRVAGTDVAINSWRWAMGAFGTNEGYPAAIEIHEERLMLSGVPSSPATIYGSNINQWDTFVEGTLATSAIKFTLSDQRSFVRWLAPDRMLVVGSDRNEWTIGTREDNEALSGANVHAQKHSSIGSDGVQPITASDMIFYAEAGGRRLRGVRYSFERDGYQSQDMSILSLHLTEEAKIVHLDHSRSPDEIVWCVLDDGSVLSFTYQAEHQVTAWSTQDFGGKVFDLNSVLQLSGDVVTMLIERDNGIYLEAMQRSDVALDFRRTLSGVKSTDIVTAGGNESLRVYDSALLERSDVKVGTGIFLRLLTPIPQLVVKYDDTQITDLVSMGNDMYWLADYDDKSKVKVFDFTTEKVLNSDYSLHSASEMQCVQALKPTVDINAVTITGLTKDTDFVVIEAAAQLLVFSSAALTVNLPDEDYTTVIPQKLVNVGSLTDIHIGIPFESQMTTVDVMNIPDAGGAGTRGRCHEFDCFVVNSVGGEVSYNGDDYEKLQYTPKNVTSGERIEAYTGKIEVKVAHGYSDEQSIYFRSSSPYPLTLSALSLKMKRSSE